MPESKDHFQVRGCVMFRRGGGYDELKELHRVAESPPDASCLIVSKDTPLFSEAHVGGKGMNVIKLVRAGFDVPDAAIVTSIECARVFDGLQELSGETLQRWVEDDQATINNFRKRLEDETLTLSTPAIELLKGFVKRTKRYAVRSSATGEDGRDSSFAGQFRTILNVKGNLSSICKAIKLCWMSCVSDEVLPYLRRTYIVPCMAVVIMEQVQSEVSGVLFQANPLSQSRANWVINAAYGQGEGVVGGLVGIDEILLNANTKSVIRYIVGQKAHMLEVDNVNGGLQRIEVDSSRQDTPCLTTGMIEKLTRVSELLAKLHRSPQDIEFAFTNNGERLYVLQSRPITTMLENQEWVAPEPGVWQLNGHLPTPLTKLYEDIWCYGMKYGTEKSSRINGLGLAAVDVAIINGFAYFCLRSPGPKTPPKSLPSPFLMRLIIRLTGQKAIKAATKFWQKKLYLDFMNAWDGEIKPNHIKEHLALQSRDLREMTDDELSKHFVEAYEYAKRMYECHAFYSMYNLGPVGHFVLRTKELSNNQVSNMEAFACLGGSSPVSEGLHGEFPGIIQVLKEHRALRRILEQDGKDAKEIIREMHATAASISCELEERLSSMMNQIAYRLSDGYDVIGKTLIETPELIIASINSSISTLERYERGASTPLQEAEKAIACVRSKITGGPLNLKEFDEILSDAKAVAKLRDERAIYCDLWAMGILRHCLLEIGDRTLSKSQFLRDPKLILEASFEEIRNLLSRNWNEDKSLWRTLSRRKQYRETGSIRNVPPILGGRALVPSRAHFPSEQLARMVHAVNFVVEEIFHSPDFESSDSAVVSPEQDDHSALAFDAKTLRGFPASSGNSTGIAKIINSSDDLNDLTKGQVVITTYSSSLINLVLPYASAIVTDFGGNLCHAAIVCREAGIPCVVGTKCATIKIKNGQTVHVDGSSGVVSIIA